MSVAKTILLLMALVLLLSGQHAEAQGEVKLVLGRSAFLDEDIPWDHFLIGGSYEIALSERVSFETQFLYLKGPGNDRDYVFTGNVAYDLIKKEHLEFYVVGAAGVLHHRNQFGTGPAFSGTELLTNGGAGVKVYITPRLYVAPEFRMGTEPFLLATISLGYKF